MSEAALNTNRELWRETAGDFYAPSIFVTESGAIGINVGGSVRVRTLREWHSLSQRRARIGQLAAELCYADSGGCREAICVGSCRAVCPGGKYLEAASKQVFDEYWAAHPANARDSDRHPEGAETPKSGSVAEGDRARAAESGSAQQQP